MIGYDTMVAAHLLDEQRPSNLLDNAVTDVGVEDWGKGNQQFGIEPGDPRDILARNQEKRAKGKKWLGDLFGEDSLGRYCALDTGYTQFLYEVQRERFSGEQGLARLLRHLVLPGLDAFALVERNGIYVDWTQVEVNTEKLQKQVDDLQRNILDNHVDPALRREWETKAKENAKSGAEPKAILDNNNFIREWVFGEFPRGLGQIPYSFTDKRGDPKTDEATLGAIDNPAVQMLIQLKKHKKNINFFDQWREWQGSDGRLHPYFNLTGTVTGRRSCGNPNLQQVPRDPMVRSCLSAPPGRIFLEVDFSQLEVRIIAWLANEETMLEVFSSGGDIYTYTAAKLLGVEESEVDYEGRRKAKAVVLGYLYGMSSRGFKIYAKETYEVEFTEAEAEAHRDTFFKTFPGIVRFHNKQEFVVTEKRQVVSPVGRIRHLMDSLSTDYGIRSKAVRQAINSPVQGLGGDWTLASVVELTRVLPRDEVLIVGDIHDAILFEIDEDKWEEHARTILGIMERPSIITDIFGVDPPVRLVAEGKIGKAWGQGIEFTLDGIGGKPTIDQASEQLAA